MRGVCGLRDHTRARTAGYATAMVLSMSCVWRPRWSGCTVSGAARWRQPPRASARAWLCHAMMVDSASSSVSVQLLRAPACSQSKLRARARASGASAHFMPVPSKPKLIVYT